MANEPRERESRQGAWRSAGALALVAVIGTSLLAGVNELTRERIAEQERRVVLRQLDEILGAGRYDNALHDDVFTFSDEGAFPGGQMVTAYRARRDGDPVAVILRLAAPDGYNGSIQLLVGIEYDGRLSGVRVTGHKETPGLGDAIETEKNDWILGFAGRSLSDPAPSGWAVAKDGGVFDQFTGATITPRAVVAAVRRALVYFQANREALFRSPTDPPAKAAR